MGDEAVSLDNSVSDENKEETQIVETVEDSESQGNEGTQPQKTFTQEDVNSFVAKRAGKEKAKAEKARLEAEERQKANALLEEENKLLKLRLEQEAGQKPKGAPNPDDYDGGEWSDEYKKDAQAYQEQQINQQVQSALEQRKQQEQQDELKRQKQEELKQHKHSYYTKGLTAYGEDDFALAEDRVTEVLGENALNHLVSDLDDSHAIVHYLGTNEDDLARIAKLLKEKPVRAIAELARLPISAKTTSNPKPEPVEELEGGSPSSGEAWARKIDKMRDKVRSGKATMKDVLSLKKQAREAGYNP
jgi:hypothetical protein